MAIIITPQGTNSAEISLQDSDALYVPNGSDVLVSGSGDDGIYAGFDSGYNYSVNMQIDGTVSASDSAIDLGSVAESVKKPSNIDIGSTGIIAGFSRGISIGGLNGTAFNLLNYGQVSSIGNFGAACDISGAGNINNYGKIFGLDGIDISYGSGNISIVNSGSISGTQDAINASGNFTLQVKNSGILSGDVLLTGQSTLDSSLGQVFGTITAGDGGDVIIAGTNGGTVMGGVGNDILRANPSQIAADNHASFKLDGYVGTDALYGGGAFNTFVTGLAGARVQIHGGASLMNDVAGYANNTVSFDATVATRSVYVDLLNGHNAYVNSNATNTGTNTFEAAIQNVPNVIGSNGRDIIRADNNGDTIQGGNGADVLYAGTGADTFVYKSYYDSHIDSASARYDTISGFATGKDKIDLSAFNSDPSHLAILNGSASTTLYLEATAGKFTPSTDLAISFAGAGAIKASDVIF